MPILVEFFGGDTGNITVSSFVSGADDLVETLNLPLVEGIEASDRSLTCCRNGLNICLDALLSLFLKLVLLRIN